MANNRTIHIRINESLYHALKEQHIDVSKHVRIYLKQLISIKKPIQPKPHKTFIEVLRQRRKLQKQKRADFIEEGKK